MWKIASSNKKQLHPHPLSPCHPPKEIPVSFNQVYIYIYIYCVFLIFFIRNCAKFLLVDPV